MKLRQTAFWFFYGMAKLLLAPLLWLAFRVRLEDRERVPRTGGLLVVSNHISMLDPPILGSFLGRPVYWLAMRELFQHRLMGLLAGCLRCLPVDRQKGDARAVRNAVRHLRAGDCVVIFPEGGIRAGDRSAFHGDGELKEGAALIALLAHVPVLPVVLTGTRAAYDWRNWFFRRPTITIRFGEPFQLEKHTSREQATQMLRSRMVQLATTKGMRDEG